MTGAKKDDDVEKNQRKDTSSSVKNDPNVENNAGNDQPPTLADQPPTLAEDELLIFGNSSSENDSKGNESGNMSFLSNI